MKNLFHILTITAALFLAACGSDDGAECNLDDATVIADSDWPTSRRDAANTARIDASFNTEAPVATCIFPGEAGEVDGDLADCATGGSPITTTVVIGPTFAEPRLVVATEDGIVHVLNAKDGTRVQIASEIDLSAAVNTPLLGADGSIFVSAASGIVARFDGDDGEELFSAPLLDDIDIAPNMGPDGVVYSGTTTGFFGAVCTNAVPRFSRNLASISVPPAVTSNPVDRERTIILAASDNGRVEALDDEEGEHLWTFFTSGRVRQSAIVVDEKNGFFIIPDTQGQIFAASIRTGRPRTDDGRPLEPYRAARCIPSLTACVTNADCGAGETCSPESITASAALGTAHVYVASEGARSEGGAILAPAAVHAFSLDFAGGRADWTYTLPPGSIIRSSPIVLTDSRGDLVVFGADLDCVDLTCSNGAIAGIRDGVLLWMIELPDPVGLASPSVRLDDDNPVIYLGTAAGKLYAVR